LKVERFSAASVRPSSARLPIGCSTPLPVTTGFMKMFSRTAMLAAMLSSARRLETKPIPFRIASAGSAGSVRLPLTRMWPAASGTWPNSARPIV
jgi:hypothetical protein